MPFIAIALAISLFLGGSAAVAAHTTVGQKAFEHATTALAHVEATLSGHADADTKGDIESDEHSQASSTVEEGSENSVDAHGALRIRGSEDGDADLDSTNSINAGGSVHVNVQ